MRRYPTNSRSLLIALLSSVCVLCAQSTAQLTEVPVKQVAAPPSDILSGIVKLPDPAQLPTVSRSALIPVKLKQVNNNQWTWSMPIAVESRGARIAFLPAQDHAWNAQLTTPDQHRLIPTPLNQPDQRLQTSASTIPWMNTDREFTHTSIAPNNAGRWTLTIQSDHNAPGFILVDSGADAALSTHVTTLSTLAHQPITLVSGFDNQGTINALTAEMTAPSGIVTSTSAKPGDSSVTVFPQEVGPHTIRIIASGTDALGNPILRTTQHLIDAAPSAPLLGAPSVRSTDDQILFEFARDESTRRTILAAEVWGSRDNEQVPVTWLSTITSGTRSLTLDTRWVALAGVDPESLELRQIRVHDVDSFVPVEIIERLPVPVTAITLPEAPPSITQDMLTGTSAKRIPAPLTPQITQAADPGHRLMLVHGYCTDAVPFTVSHFSGDLAIFEDFEQSRSHDAFALQMLAQSAPMKSFGVVAHSQGGMAALHLKTYYWSGLDWARGNRLIQSVGAPYQGTALAGNAAVLGDIFGFGCGQNDNMTYTGSAAWLSLIPTSTREEVYYYTTSFEDGFGLDYCNFFTDLLLSDPDDGVIERSAGQLPGANNMGHLEGWCHTADMRDPGQCTDQSRNTIMNQEAKR